MDTLLANDKIEVDDQFRLFKEGFAKVNSIRTLLEECKKEPDDERREFIRQLIVKTVYEIKSENLRK